MGVDVVRTILCVVINDENFRLRPELAVRHGIDDNTYREIIVGIKSKRSECSSPGARRMIVAQAHNADVRSRALAFE